MTIIRFALNGLPTSGDVRAWTSMADALRETFQTRGVHVGCEQGACGACTVLVDGKAMRSCLMLATQAEGHEVVTVEGIAADHRAAGGGNLPDAFLRHRAFQCGFCTPGMIVGLMEILEAHQEVTTAEVRERLSGHICRCTGYEPIVAAACDVLQSAGLLAGEAP